MVSPESLPAKRGYDCHAHWHKPFFPLNGGSMIYGTGEHASRNESA
jgi:hypothetical protein